MSIISSEQHVQQTHPSTQQRDVVVIGAGPYGLSIAAHLAAKGVNVAIFGKPLELWRDNMPSGMFLRSHWWASNLSDPQKKYGLKQFFEVSPYTVCYPMPIQLFIDYGMWFQKHVVPFVDPTYVSLVEQNDRQFMMTLVDGRRVEASSVVMAIGPGYYHYIPAEYAHLPVELLTHTFASSDFSRFAGKTVAIIGGGQSALEWAALLYEAGAAVHVIARRPIVWFEPHGEAKRPFIERLIAPDSGITTGWKFRGLEVFPYFFQRFPQETKARMVKNTHWPAASNWLQDRIFGKVVLHEGHVAVHIAESDRGVKLTLSDNSCLHIDHIITATGYRTDTNRLTLLHPSILAHINTYAGSPVLNPWFESSVLGLYFAGFSTLQSFGPLYRFVAGVPATAPRIARAAAHHVAKTR